MYNVNIDIIVICFTLDTIIYLKTRTINSYVKAFSSINKVILYPHKKMII